MLACLSLFNFLDSLYSNLYSILLPCFAKRFEHCPVFIIICVSVVASILFPPFVLLKPRLFLFWSFSGASVCVCVYVFFFLHVCLWCVRAHAAKAVRWRLMVIAVSRLAFWVESVRVGVKRVARSRQRSSILCGTPRTAPCVLGADRGDLSLR